MAVTTAAVIGAASAVGGVAMSAKAQSDAKKASQAAANAPAPTVDIAALQRQSQDIARENARNSSLLEQQYNPGAAQLRRSSLTGLTNSLAPNLQVDSIGNRIFQQAGAMPTGISYDSPLLREAIAKASADLSLGGQLPQDVRNLVMRGALAKSGNVSGGLSLGRDLGVRDLGLTSLQLENQRLQNASALGQQEAGLGQGNAALSLQAQLAGQNNLFESANFLQQLNSGNFAKQLAAAQLGQNIAQPMSGLDPGSVANLAVGNSNATAAQGQYAAGLGSAAANQKSALGGQLVGTGLGFVQNYFNNRAATPAYNGKVNMGPMTAIDP